MGQFKQVFTFHLLFCCCLLFIYFSYRCHSYSFGHLSFILILDDLVCICFRGTFSFSEFITAFYKTQIQKVFLPTEISMRNRSEMLEKYSLSTDKEVQPIPVFQKISSKLNGIVVKKCSEIQEQELNRHTQDYIICLQ